MTSLQRIIRVSSRLNNEPPRQLFNPTEKSQQVVSWVTTSILPDERREGRLWLAWNPAESRFSLKDSWKPSSRRGALPRFCRASQTRSYFKVEWRQNAHSRFNRVLWEKELFLKSNSVIMYHVKKKEQFPSQVLSVQAEQNDTVFWWIVRTWRRCRQTARRYSGLDDLTWFGRFDSTLFYCRGRRGGADGAFRLCGEETKIYLLVSPFHTTFHRLCACLCVDLVCCFF